MGSSISEPMKQRNAFSEGADDGLTPDVEAGGDGAAAGAMPDPGEDVLERHHARIGEEQGRVVERHERTRRHDLMAMPLEMIEED